MIDDDDNYLRYDKMVEYALRGVVKQALEEVIKGPDADSKMGYDDKKGAPSLLGDHHFYITFLTDYPGVKIPDYLRDRYPGEMTIVLQFQFYDLAVNDERMKVTLSFNNVPEKLEIPLAAITIFADPSVNFALQFQPLGDDLEPDYDPDDDPEGGDDSDSGKSKKGSSKTGEVVSLDKFRKK